MANNMTIENQRLGSQQNRGGNSAKPSPALLIMDRWQASYTVLARQGKNNEVRRRVQREFGLRDHYYLARRLLAQRLALCTVETKI